MNHTTKLFVAPLITVIAAGAVPASGIASTVVVNADVCEVTPAPGGFFGLDCAGRTAGRWVGDTRTASTNASLLTAGDLNGDGLPDAVVRNPDSYVHALLSNADGTWRDVRTTVFGVRSVALADLSGDGKLDLVAGDFDGQYRPYVSVSPGRGDGTFGRPSSEGFGTWPVTFADVDGDGDADVAAGTALLRNDGGALRAAGTLPAAARRAADADRDGDVDPYADGTLLRNDGGAFTAAGTFEPGPFDVGDVDGDGAVDVVTTTRVLLGTGATVDYRTGAARDVRVAGGQILVAGGGAVAFHRLDGATPVPGEPTPTPAPGGSTGTSPLETILGLIRQGLGACARTGWRCGSPAPARAPCARTWSPAGHGSRPARSARPRALGRCG